MKKIMYASILVFAGTISHVQASEAPAANTIGSIITSSVQAIWGTLKGAGAQIKTTSTDGFNNSATWCKTNPKTTAIVASLLIVVGALYSTCFRKMVGLETEDEADDSMRYDWQACAKCRR